jgi:hypothetical protein
VKRHFLQRIKKEGGAKTHRMTHLGVHDATNFCCRSAPTDISIDCTKSRYPYPRRYYLYTDSAMAHRRVKEIEYDDDEYDEYYSGEDEYGYDAADAAPAQAASQEDELSPEDKEQMRIGTESVRAALGDASDFVTDDAIQEALWHYYYDVAKSVTYLKSKTHPFRACSQS